MTEHEDRCAVPATAAISADAPMFNRAAWLRILPFAAYLAFIVIGDVLERLGVPQDALRWLYPAKIALVALLLALFWRQYRELSPFYLTPSQLLTALATGVLVLVLWISLDADWMVVGSPSGFDPRVDGRIDWLLVAIRIAGAALVVPVMEELFWRSFLMRWVDAPDFESVVPSQLTIKSFVITVVLFGVEHNLWLAGIVAGAAYSLLYMRHRNLWSPILAHAVTNGLLGVWVVRTGSWSYW
ncbi:CAAX prenyl protease-related protein [Telluria mixta]|uniref:CAAX prenyl protease-related protein n=1 Tax=Telluria mixta TaxID=34071 RepID=A0ABT2C7U6_9BURK|nr:CAAX prenyl protease-related protein [Telluria mixta]MCS0633474.1 CAAX prenyl protease-related protein [Telluria mixta]WEM96257.1 CAAX prenyl protease-related protein [Telluria mixta]